MSDLGEAVSNLHSSVDIHLSIRRTKPGLWLWSAITSGENFLDGPWKRTDRGVARNPKRALRAAFRAARS